MYFYFGENKDFDLMRIYIMQKGGFKLKCDP